MKNSIVVITGIVLVVLFLVGGYVYKQNANSAQAFVAQENYGSFVKDHSPTLGDKEAKVHIVEFFDPLCGTCQAFYPFTKDLLKKYDGKVKLTLRYVTFHEGSEFIIRLLEAAKMQGKFWESLDVVVQTASFWADHNNPRPEALWGILEKSEVKLDINKLRSDIYSEDILQVIQADRADVKKLDIRKTPSFFVNGKALKNFGYKELEALVQEEVEAQY